MEQLKKFRALIINWEEEQAPCSLKSDGYRGKDVCTETQTPEEAQKTFELFAAKKGIYKTIFTVGLADKELGIEEYVTI